MTAKADKQTLEVFKKFDLNGDGIITRDELASVFTSVDPVHWTDARVGRLMDAVDVNRDGRIRYDEFVNWLFEEEGQNVDEDTEEGQQAVKFLARSSTTTLDASNLVDDSRRMSQLTGPLTVKLKQTADQRLGIKIDTSDKTCLRITSIQPKGLLGLWNENNNQPGKIMPGDKILEVNGIRDNKEMMKELKLKPDITLSIQSYSIGKTFEDNLEDYYTLDKEPLYQGEFSVINRAIKKATGTVFTAKSIPKKNVDSGRFEETVGALQLMDHPNVIKLHSVFEDFVNYHLVLEHCRGGTLFDAVLDADDGDRQGLREWVSSRVLQQVLSGISYMHDRSISHRALKAESILLKESREADSATVKVIDFRNARSFKDKQGNSVRFRTQCGDIVYTAPEVFQGVYKEQCDAWSCGILAYFMMSGYPPFDDNPQNIKGAAVIFGEDWDQKSDSAKSLIKGLLTKDVSKRLTLREALGSEFFNSLIRNTSSEQVQKKQTQMKSFGKNTKMKKVALLAMARNMNDSEIRELQDMFKQLDANHDMTVTMHELKSGLEKLGKPETLETVRQMMEQLDIDGNNRIDYTEFIAATLDRRKALEESTCWAAFNVFDRDGSGLIERRELAEVLLRDEVQGLMGDAAVKRVLACCDANGDGNLDFEEFMDMMRAEEDGSLQFRDEL